jgi:hypothetical protein
MDFECNEPEDSEEKLVAERLIQHMDATFHPYIIAALGAACAVLSDEAEDEAESEEILSESCQVFFEFMIAFMYRVGEAEEETLWQTGIEIGREIYGDERVQVAASFAIEHLKEYKEGCEDELDDEPPHVSRTLN